MPCIQHSARRFSSPSCVRTAQPRMACALPLIRPRPLVGSLQAGFQKASMPSRAAAVWALARAAWGVGPVKVMWPILRPGRASVLP